MRASDLGNLLRYKISASALKWLLLLFLLPFASAILAQQPGSEGLGDRLYPELGNGGYDVEHYSIDLQFWPQEYRIYATTVINAVATQDLSRFSLDLFGLSVDSVSVNSTDSTFEHVEHKLIISPVASLAEGDAFTVTIEYGGRPLPVDDPGAYWQALGWQYVTDDYYMTDGEPTGSMNWFPCNNHPSDKATYTIRVTVPAGLTVASNGVLTEQVENEDQTDTFVWTMDDPMSSHNAFVAVGDFVTVRDDTGPVPIRNFFPRASAEALADTFTETQAMMSWLVDILGPYPFAEYGVVVFPETDTSADNQTISVFDPAFATEDYILHQLAHQWFGNSVTQARWEDMWLKEGFASYLEFTYPDGIWQQSAKEELVAWAGSGMGAPTKIEVEQLYGTATFWRGALTLDALRAEVGDEVFFDILRTFYQQYAYSVATTEDFIALAESVSGQDLEALFNAWLYEDAVPALPE